MKSRIEELAVFGGAPAFSQKLHVGAPNIGDRERLMERINDLLDRRWLTNDGPYLQQFEQLVTEMVGVKHCVAVCNATIGLEIVIRAAGLVGEVIVPSFTFIATAHALEWQGIKPVFCDIDPTTHNLDPGCVERLITPSTTGIIGVHLWGRPCNVSALTEIARRRKLRLLFDAAHAFGCSYQGAMVGNFGDAEVFSFHATKFLNSFEGGAIVTNDDGLANKLRLMRNFGFADYDHVVMIGTNGKMSEVSAAMGLTSLESLDEFIAVNHRNYQLYRRLLANVPGIRFQEYDEREKCNYQYIVLEIDEGETSLNRDQWQEILWAENVIARRYFYPGCHRMEPYCSESTQALLPNTELVASRVLCLPTGTAVTADEVKTICQIIRLITSQDSQIAKRLKGAYLCHT